MPKKPRFKNNYLLVVEPGKAPRVENLEGTLESLQKAVGGYIEAVYPYDDPVAIIVNEEGKLNGLPMNRALRDEDGDVYDIICGTFLVAGLADEDFCSLSPELLVKYALRFAHTETFHIMDDGRIKVYKMGVNV
jgi:hypothetical protein